MMADQYSRWAWWFAGCIDFYHPGRLRPPVSLVASREFNYGRDHARQGYVRVPDYAEGIAMLRHVQAGNAPFTFSEAAR